jgi:hypothetical protein
MYLAKYRGVLKLGRSKGGREKPSKFRHKKIKM